MQTANEKMAEKRAADAVDPAERGNSEVGLRGPSLAEAQKDMRRKDPQVTTRPIDEMTELERIETLNKAHNIIRQCEQQIKMQETNVNNIMMYMNQPKELVDTEVEKDVIQV